MAKKLSPLEEQQLIAKYKTGAYTQRELSQKFGVSKGTVGNIIKGIPKDNESIVEELVKSKLGKTAERVTPIKSDIDREIAIEAIEKVGQKVGQNDNNVEVGQKVGQVGQSIEEIKAVLEEVDKKFMPLDMFNNSLILNQHVANSATLSMMGENGYADVQELNMLSQITARNKDGYLKDEKFYQKPNQNINLQQNQTTIDSKDILTTARATIEL